MRNSLIAKRLAKPIDAIVHFGAGRGSELDTYKRSGAKKVILVEANPEHAAVLERLVVDMKGTEVIQAAVSGSNEPVTMKMLNLLDASSLRSPTGLANLFPGIRVVRTLSVAGQLPQDILGTQELDANNKNVLVIDVPGEEMVVLKELEVSGYMELFGTVFLRCGVSPLYEGAEPADSLLKFLTSRGYEVDEVDEYDDPDYPQWLLKKDTVKRENLQLREKVKQLTRECDEQKQLAEQRQDELEQLTERQRKLDDEIVKAETQIDLLKDVLISKNDSGA